MKKSFLQTFIVLVLFGFFSILNTNLVFAQFDGGDSYYAPPAAPVRLFDKTPYSPGKVLRTTPNLACDDGPCIRVDYQDGYFTYEKSDGRTDYYLPGQKQGDSPTHTESSTFKTAKEVAKSIEQSGKSVWDCGTNPISCAIGTGAYAVMQFSYLGLWVAGNLFDKIFEYTTTVIDQNIFGSIKNAWTIVRDIANIFIVFSLLYLGIKTILQGNGFAETKMLVGIIIAAILINFSLIFVQTAFNISNIIGGQIGAQISFEQGSRGTLSISEGLTKMIRTDKVSSFVLSSEKDNWAEIWSRVQTAIFTSVTTVLLALTLATSVIMLAYRYIVFIVLMITAPFGIISKFIPWFKELGDSWWKALKTQFIVLPAYVLTLYISILFVAPLSAGLNASDLTTGSIASGTGSFTAGFITFVFNFLLIIGFLLLPLILPGKLGAAGAGAMTSVANWTTNKIRNAPRRIGQRTAQVGATGVAKSSRALGGFVGDKITGLQNLKDIAQKNTGIKGSLARFALRRGDALKNSSYDIRNTSFGKNLGIGSGIETYSKAISSKKDKLLEKQKKEEKLYGFDKPNKNDPEVQKAQQQQKRDLEKAKAERDIIGEEIELAENELQEAIRSGVTGKTLEDLQDKIINKQKALEDSEKKVGQLMVKKQEGYINLMQARQQRILNKQKYSITARKALKEIKDQIEKDYKEKGKYVPKQNKKKDEKKDEKKEEKKTEKTVGETSEGKKIVEDSEGRNRVKWD